MAAHLELLLKALMLSESGRTREIVDNFEIACSQCRKPVPFEPRSMYRRRKCETVSKRLMTMADLAETPDKPGQIRVMGDEERSMFGFILETAHALFKFLESDFPLEQIREACAEAMTIVERDVKSMGPGVNLAESMRLLREIAAIAQADIGEREDLVDVASDELERDQERLMAKLVMLNQEQVKPAATKPAAADKSNCFIATAACGTPDHPLVQILRDFRDRSLVGNKLGRGIVRLYDHFSPPAAVWISARPLARHVVRTLVVRPAAFCARFTL